MDVLNELLVHFPVSGVETYLFIPPLVAFVVSFITSMGGVSGAFVLLPFQVSVLGYTAPSVSATNQVFNLVAIPSGVWRYLREKRMVWPLTWAVIVGTLPGVVIGAYLRITILSDSGDFRLFAGMVLLYIGVRLLLDVMKTRRRVSTGVDNRRQLPTHFEVSDTRFSFKHVEFQFAGELFRCSTLGIVALCLVVGIAGGIYGIGGGAIVAPFFVSVFRLPVHAVAGAALMGTFVTSFVGVAIYHILSLVYPAQSVAPDWYLGLLFGIGGVLGMYVGARCQKYVPARVVKTILLVIVLSVAGKYIVGFFV
ncbi:MAG: TSUP family transporter [candidate division Zixibacteria bacterium]|nr:TSUP family transporter [candidate division Zixibacteria bacterium]